MAERVCLGAITGAHGVRGKVKVKPFTENPDDVGSYGPVTDEAGTRSFTLQVVGWAKEQVVVRLEGSIDGTSYSPLISNTITENGNYIYNILGSPVKKIRANFFKETGGTNAVVQFDVAAN